MLREQLYPLFWKSKLEYSKTLRITVTTIIIIPLFPMQGQELNAVPYTGKLPWSPILAPCKQRQCKQVNQILHFSVEKVMLQLYRQK